MILWTSCSISSGNLDLKEHQGTIAHLLELLEIRFKRVAIQRTACVAGQDEIIKWIPNKGQREIIAVASCPVAIDFLWKKIRKKIHQTKNREEEVVPSPHIRVALFAS